MVKNITADAPQRINARWCVYIVQCEDGTFYTGITTDLPRRLIQHNKGKGAKYTRARLPVTLVYSRPNLTQGEARRAEYHVKKLAHKIKNKVGLLNSIFEQFLEGGK